MGLLIGVVGCTVPPQKEKAAPAKPELAEQLERRAAQRARDGDFEGAARLYTRLATQAEPPKQQALRLKAAENLFQAGALEQAASMVAGLDQTQLDAAARARRRILAARIALERNEPKQALAALDQLSGQLSFDLAVKVHQLRARAYHAAGDPVASLHERIALGRLLQSPAQRRANNEAIFRTLNELPDQSLETLREETNDTVLKGWLQLARLARTPPLAMNRFRRALNEWQQANPEHPGNTLVDKLLSEYRQTVYRPEQIALLLPLHGRLAKAAEAIRDGFLAAYYADRGSQAQRPTIQVYDLGEDSTRAWSIYQRAVDDGADFVIGPLSKAATRTLARASKLAVPTLSLNALTAPEADLETPDTLYQFALLPEDEARQVAAYGRAKDHERALVLVPQGQWGTRVANAFSDEFRTQGGTVLARQGYDPRANDFSEDITTLLNLDDSRARYRRLRSTLGRELEFEPRRRKDVDFIFLAAFPRQGRLIRPQLRFHRASGLPVYATSHVYAGHPQPEADQDMDGIAFCDTPWTLMPERTLVSVRDAVLGVRPEGYERYPRLYAMGADAYNIVPYLKRLERDPYRRYSGGTGRLYMDNRRRLHRSLVCAQFANGKPAITETTVPSFRLTGTEANGEPGTENTGPPQRDVGTGLSPAPGPQSGSP